MRRFTLILTAVLALSLLAALLSGNGEDLPAPAEPVVDSLPFVPVEIKPLKRDQPETTPRRMNSRAWALEWLAAEQQEDGSWAGPVRRTGLALLAFISCAETHKHGRYKKTVLSGFRYLGRSQRENGLFLPDGRNPSDLDQVIAALAVGEAWAMTSSPIFKSTATQAIAALSRVKAFDERTQPWAALVFEYARIMDLDVGRSTHEWYDPDTRTYDAQSHAAGVMCRALAGERPRTSRSMHVGWPLFLDEIGRCFDPSHLYFGTMALLAVGSGPGPRWWRSLSSFMDQSQEEDGSFCPAPQGPDNFGRVGITALMVMARSGSECYQFHLVKDVR